MDVPYDTQAVSQIGLGGYFRVVIEAALGSRNVARYRRYSSLEGLRKIAAYQSGHSEIWARLKLGTSRIQVDTHPCSDSRITIPFVPQTQNGSLTSI